MKKYLLLGGVGLLWYLSKNKKSEKSISKKEDNASEEDNVRSITTTEITETGIPNNEEIKVSSYELEQLILVCDYLDDVYDWYQSNVVPILMDDNTLAESGLTLEQRDEIILILEDWMNCSNIMCNAVNEITPEKTLSSEIISAINESVFCVQDLELRMEQIFPQ